MKFTATALPGAFLVEPEPHNDERGFFARVWCARELAEHGLDDKLAQASVSYNRSRGTLRGMHYQAPPHTEAKLVSCTRGAIFDVLVDLRPGPTRAHWVGYELSGTNRRMLYVPEGVAHGYLTLEDDTELLYMIAEFQDPASARGVRYDDPAFAIAWPSAPRVISPRDAGYPDYRA